MAHSLIRNSIKSLNPKLLSTLSAHRIARRFGSVAAADEEQSSSFTFSSEGDSVHLRAPVARRKQSSSVTMPMSFMTGSIVGKRFYKEVKTREADDGNGWTVMLDYRTLKTPAKRPLKLPTLALAKAIAAEWEYQVWFLVFFLLFVVTCSYSHSFILNCVDFVKLIWVACQW